MKHIHASFLVPLGLSLLSAHPSVAQQVSNYGRSPSINVLTTPSVDASVYKYGPQNGFDCPTTSFSFGGFGAGGNDWSNDFTTNGSSGSGINNYGIAAGLRVPLGGESAKNCKEYSKTLLERARIETDGARRNDQIKLLTQCHWLFVNEINTNQASFLDEKNGAFSSLNVCNSFSFKKPGPNNADGQKVRKMRTPKELTEPPLSPKPPEVPFVIQRNVN